MSILTLARAFVMGCVLSCATIAGANAQGDAQKNAVLGSPYLAKAKACMDSMVAAGKSAGVDTDRDGGDILILDPSDQAKLGGILGNTFSCLDTAFGMAKKKIDRRPGANVSGTRSWVWHASVAGMFIWCASDGDSIPTKVGTLGGNGPKKNWYAINLQCSIGDKVLGWYTP